MARRHRVPQPSAEHLCILRGGGVARRGTVRRALLAVGEADDGYHRVRPYSDTDLGSVRASPALRRIRERGDDLGAPHRLVVPVHLPDGALDLRPLATPTTLGDPLVPICTDPDPRRVDVPPAAALGGRCPKC